jgi:hypothetical protein
MSAGSRIRIALIPDPWKRSVIALLRAGGHDQVIWTTRARSDWSYIDDYGTREAGHDLLIRQLSIPGILGHDHPPMQDHLDVSFCETWAFLCPHPQGVPTPVYAKVALHDSRLRINLISLHIDLTKALEEAIRKFQAP